MESELLAAPPDYSLSMIADCDIADALITPPNENSFLMGLISTKELALERASDESSHGGSKLGSLSVITEETLSRGWALTCRK